ncbi:hypothetical protein INT43_005642 [Umbelopsis isabellina]|uniref:Pyroglutamyl-peptidase I n=1 Tax=Mortierella isabellina TaxID=91625 RepID=A0A8H7UDZ4_MORIS|nr:hypothetical protein INT43_005642 [Umbelopsis isabellina]
MVVNITEDSVNVLVTGFEVCGKHAINPSWEVAKTFSGTTIKSGKKEVLLSSIRLPVEYQPIIDIVPPLHREPHNFNYVFHIGVGLNGPIRMETLARNGPYNKIDNRNETPVGEVIEGPPQLFTKVNVEHVIEWGKSKKGWKDNVRLSTDAGLYLCEWTLFTSLRESVKEDSSNATVLFIHVPQIGEGEGMMTLESMTQTVSEIIEGVIANSN